MAAERGSSPTSGELGAYGLRLANVERARPFLSRARASWPRLEIKRKRGESGTPREWLTETEAC